MKWVFASIVHIEYLLYCRPCSARPLSSWVWARCSRNSVYADLCFGSRRLRSQLLGGLHVLAKPSQELTGLRLSFRCSFLFSTTGNDHHPDSCYGHTLRLCIIACLGGSEVIESGYSSDECVPRLFQSADDIVGRILRLRLGESGLTSYFRILVGPCDS